MAGVMGDGNLIATLRVAGLVGLGCGSRRMRARLVIVAKRAVEVRECDRCGREPANTWRIIGPDGAPREIELCDQHGAPVANAYALARPVVTRNAPRTVRIPTGDTRSAGTPAAAAPEPIWR
jgi:hypothetical protein